MFEFINNLGDLTDYTLILPSVSVGNVGQLAMDLLIATLRPKKVGSINHPALLPVVGGDPFDDNKQDLMTSCEVFKQEAQKLILIQIRSPVIKARREDFVEKLLVWVKEQQLKQVILLTSSHAYERIDAQLSGSPLRYLANAAAERLMETAVRDLNWLPLERRPPFPVALMRDPSDSEAKDTDDIFIPGGCFAKTLYVKSQKESISLVVLLKFCSEGDNAPDALLLADYLNQWLKLVPLSSSTSSSSSKSGDCRPHWQIPVSWKLLFGNPAPPYIF